MKLSLSLKLGQQLKMTPQLQQAIRLMQLSTLELNLEVQQAIEANPMLELTDDADDAGDEEENEDQWDDPDGETEPTAQDSETPGDEEVSDDEWDGDDAAVDVSLDAATDGNIPDELPVDTSWEDMYQPSPSMPAAVPEDNDYDRNPTTESLIDHLLWQLNLTPISDRDKLIGSTIIEAINSDGMLTLGVDELTACLDEDLLIEADEVEAVLKLVQHFDPAGVAARNVRECLLLQLHQLPNDTPDRDQALMVIELHFDLLAARDFNTLARKSKLDHDDLKLAMELILSLNARPGSAVGEIATEYIKPDVFVKKDGNRWLLELNADVTPRVRINPDYACLVRRADASDDNTFLRRNLQEARWFLKSLQNRSDTLLKVATKIVEHQRGFLDYGEEAMKPLVLAEIADAVGMHESTISRVTTRKYMHTPRGIFELKYFFSSHVGTSTGGEVSSTAIRALIRKHIADENAVKPLSDSKIASILLEQNIKVARRTVAKYRESMSIPPSNERKRLV